MCCIKWSAELWQWGGWEENSRRAVEIHKLEVLLGTCLLSPFISQKKGSLGSPPLSRSTSETARLIISPHILSFTTQKMTLRCGESNLCCFATGQKSSHNHCNRGFETAHRERQSFHDLIAIVAFTFWLEPLIPVDWKRASCQPRRLNGRNKSVLHSTTAKLFFQCAASTRKSALGNM